MAARKFFRESHNAWPVNLGLLLNERIKSLRYDSGYPSSPSTLQKEKKRRKREDNLLIWRRRPLR